VKGKYFETLKGIPKNIRSSDRDVCRFAASEGHLEILKSARENGFEWDEETCNAAMQRGRFKILKWSVENGCPCPLYLRNFVENVNKEKLSNQSIVKY
jgi:hypothetical protein